jgi:DNA-binding CsgD family transcriptional regulator
VGSRDVVTVATLFGREQERSRIADLLAAARASRSAALVISGEPGVGKSALLDDARDQADGIRVLAGSGVESEAQLPFAGLHQIVRPVLGLVEDLPAPQAAALRGALGLATGGSDDRFVVSLAALSLLAEASDRGPLLCLVDDAHWLDDASADALVFVARRLDAEGIVMLFATREGESRRFEARGLPELRLGGLDPTAAAALVERQVAGRALAPEVRDRLVAETGGNPLALLELPAVLSREQLTGTEPLVAPIPVSGRVERAFLDRVRSLPGATQTLLLIAAADDSGVLATVLRAAGQLGVAGEALDAAEDAGLVQAGDGRLALRHPLVRSAVYHGASLSRRQAVHRALATAADGDGEGDRRAWHLAAASVEPDPFVVDELERAAARARQRGGFGGASLALERAAALTADDHERGRHLTTAGEDAWVAGQTARARLLLDRARPLVVEPVERADIDAYLGLIEMTRGIPAQACRLLVGAAREVAAVDGDRALRLLNLASIGATFTGDGVTSRAIAALAPTLTVEDTPVSRTLVDVLVGLGAHFAGDYAVAAPKLRSALPLEEAAADDWSSPMPLFLAGRAAFHLGDDQSIQRSTHASAARARADGALGPLTNLLARLAHAELWVGRWSSAAASATEGLQLARELDQPHLAAHQLAILAVIAANRGEADQCRALVAESRALAADYGLALATDFADWALTLLALALGDATEAFRRCRSMSTTVVRLWAGIDRIEAAIRAGEASTAREWLASFAAWADSGDIAWGQAVARHCTALLADDDEEAEHHFVAAAEAHGEADRPFERARTELAFGEFLRRTRRRVDAREHLHTALDGFETLGATPWAERARVELRASGQTARRRDPSTRVDLTPQELQVAQLVAEGHSNRDAAARLFVSPRTIDFHLRNVFTKLGITSRVELVRLDLDNT